MYNAIDANYKFLIHRLSLFTRKLTGYVSVQSTFRVENQEQLNYLNLKRYAFFLVRRSSPDFSGNLFLSSRRHGFHRRKKEKKNEKGNYIIIETRERETIRYAQKKSVSKCR